MRTFEILILSIVACCLLYITEMMFLTCCLVYFICCEFYKTNDKGPRRKAFQHVLDGTLLFLE